MFIYLTAGITVSLSLPLKPVLPHVHYLHVFCKTTCVSLSWRLIVSVWKNARTGLSEGPGVTHVVTSPVVSTGRSVWSSCSLSIWAKWMFQWLPIRTRSGRFSSILSSSSSLWVTDFIHSSLHYLIFNRNLRSCGFRQKVWIFIYLFIWQCTLMTISSTQHRRKYARL